MNKIAFIKFGGLATGGTEVFLQTLAVNLSNSNFKVDFFYCDSAPYIGSDWKHPDTDKSRKKYVENSKVVLKKFKILAKDITTPTHDWVDSNFWEIFDETNYDLIVSARAGHPEYPFTRILNIPIINFVTLNAGVDNQKNIYRNVLISNWSAKQWLNSGGDENRLEIFPLLREMEFNKEDAPPKSKELFNYGFHQRENDGIFSDIPLNAYSKIMSDKTQFTLLGGSKKYSQQANDLGLINFTQIDHTGDETEIHNFLNSLDVFAHGRSDGETFGLVFTEAMFHGLPLLSHEAQNNAQYEVIGNAGKVFNQEDIVGYATEMFRLKNNKHYYNKLSKNSLDRYSEYYSFESNFDNLIDLINRGISNIS
jgi:hypothetical protein